MEEDNTPNDEGIAEKLHFNGTSDFTYGNSFDIASFNKNLILFLAS